MLLRNSHNSYLLSFLGEIIGSVHIIGKLFLEQYMHCRTERNFRKLLAWPEAPALGELPGTLGRSGCCTPIIKEKSSHTES